MSSTQKVKIDYCSHKAAKYAVENWHYSGTMPFGKKIKIGVWENDDFIGCVLFSRGATPNLLKPYGLEQTEGCELTRVAMRDHDVEVTYCLSEARKLLKEKCPGLKIIISFADKEQDHLGTIYQADNWYYLGTTGKQNNKFFVVNGDEYHGRSLGQKYGEGGQDLEWLQNNVDPNAKRVEKPGKHRYAYPLTKPMRYKLKKLKEPYPKQ